MSLNWKEIDLVLSELDLPGFKIERIVQPSYDTLCLGLYKAGHSLELLVSIAQGACRIHSLSSAPPKPDRPLRFMECLRSRLRGGRIEKVEQLGEERILRFEISVMRTQEEGAEPELMRYILYARLWSGAGNLVLCEESGKIVDVMARRPGRGELSGERCVIEERLGKAATSREFEVRELPPVEDRPGGGSFSERLESWYAARGSELSRENLVQAARERFEKRRRVLETRIAELSSRREVFREADRLRELGDILLASQGGRIGGGFLLCEDFYRGGEISIPVNHAWTIVENAESYYSRYKKASSGLSDVESQIVAGEKALAEAAAELSAIESMADPFLIAKTLKKGGGARERPDRQYPGLSLLRSGWTILVGRSAKENDELLRRHVRGSDTWLHARDWPGSYVFVKARAGKTIPLEILLDAANLAIYYSKGRSNGGGDVYYTYVKYLRRAKGGPKGLVIPMQEKNLSIELDEARLKELRALIGDEN